MQSLLDALRPDIRDRLEVWVVGSKLSAPHCDVLRAIHDYAAATEADAVFSPGLPREIVKVVRSVASWVKGTKLIQTALVALTGTGVIKLVRAIPALVGGFAGLRTALARLGLLLFKVIGPFLLLEDIIVFLSGGKSAIGKGLDAAFGPGTAKNIQALVAEMVRFFGLFRAEPDKVRAAFASLPDDLAKELGGFGRFLGGWGQQIVNLGLFVTNALTGGWENFVAKAKAGGQGILLAFKILSFETSMLWVKSAAIIQDAFANAWNGIVSGAQAALNAMLEVLARLPGSDDLVKKLRVSVESISGYKASADARQGVAALQDRARLAFASQGDVIAAAATAPASSIGGSTSVTNNTEVNVTVPPGTPADLARGVAGTTGKVIEKINLRATKDALVNTAG